MAREFKLPDLGEGIHEGEIIAVKVAVGDMVKEEQPIFEVETDKAATEIPSPYSGRVTAINVKAGDTVHVGDVLMVFDGGGEAPAVTPPEEKSKTSPESREARGAAEGLEKAAGLPPTTKPTLVPAAQEPTAPVEKAAPSPTEGPVPASPATRRLARELGVDLHQVPGSGPAGLVTAEDVRRFAEGARPAQPEPEVKETVEEAAPVPTPAQGGVREVTAPPLPDFGKWGAVETTPLRSVRRATARHMALAWSQIPHVSTTDEADITELEAFRRRHQAGVEKQGGKLTLTVFALKAAVAALKAFPMFNSSLDMEREEVILKHYYHLGVATDTDRGLMVPVMRDVDRKSVVELSKELSAMALRARDGQTPLEEMQGGTFTITNIGMLGGRSFAPIINYPEVAILGLARAKLEPVVRMIGEGAEDYEIRPRLMLPLILAFDHRVVDGAEAARFLRRVAELLENPETLLLTL